LRPAADVTDLTAFHDLEHSCGTVIVPFRLATGVFLPHRLARIES
jgi:hypothetical protein